MQTIADKIIGHLASRHRIQITESEATDIIGHVLDGHRDALLEIETGLCKKQREECIAVVNKALADYHHVGMSTAEIQRIVSGSVGNRAETPGGILDTVRFLKAS